MWCVPAITPEFVGRMEDVLTTYALPYDAAEPVLCLDERPVVLHADARPPVPNRPGRPMRRDHEYVRHGTANIFAIIEPLTGRRLTHATPNRTGRQFGLALGKIARRYPNARRIHLVHDNLNTHCLKSCIEAYGDVAGRALWARFVVHHTPKHASWLNAAEMEISLVSRECLGTKRRPSFETLRVDVARWRTLADAEHRPINWQFRVSDARRVFKYDALNTPQSQH
jgi:hypothetical protein